MGKHSQTTVFTMVLLKVKVTHIHCKKKVKNSKRRFLDHLQYLSIKKKTDLFSIFFLCLSRCRFFLKDGKERKYIFCI